MLEYHRTDVSEGTDVNETNPHGMRRRSDVLFRSHKGRDVADHAEMLS